jgi:hypothetical protein
MVINCLTVINLSHTAVGLNPDGYQVKFFQGERTIQVVMGGLIVLLKSGTVLMTDII